MNMYDCGTFEFRGQRVGVTLDFDSAEDDGRSWFHVLQYSNLKSSDFVAVPKFDAKGRKLVLRLRDGSVEVYRATDARSAEFARLGIIL